ncbi:GMC family oxidoreductase [Alloyangia pacifica]|uniref:Choline dehydrogenase n=1 Tax=Alloyangia pacifica TaxID=311180 RepID=A0A1I6UXS3_9RHOB|nr:GMC family oxidoreductase [Alloyangia pacifica]SDI29936.1 Choline dehydrogenase [Alloyangia pacifica]SFT06222.1 Choline dehydrogenase [Alloyangia pacifica]
MIAKDDIRDVLIIGSGATGAINAKVLAEAGLDVICLEQGGWIERKEFVHTHSDWGWERNSSWNPDVNARSHPDDYPVDSDASKVLMWNGVGGSTNVYGAIWPRYRPSDFRKGDEHGLQPNWPISYEDLAPFYERVDRLLGTSGLNGDPAMPPRPACPTGPLPFTPAAQRLSKAFDKLGWHWWPAEAGVISEDYDGRPGCNGCGLCNGCPRGSMTLYSQSVWPKALAAGAELKTHARVLRIETGPDGRATGVVWKNRITGALERTRARVVIVAANGVGTPRLLLASGIGNSSGMVGRNLLHHTLVGAQMWVDEPVNGHMGYVASMFSRQFAETDVSRGFVNGFNFNCLTSTPSAGEMTAGWHTGTRAPWGKGHHDWFERHFGHSIGLFAIGDDLPNPENRVFLDDKVVDEDGVPIARMHYEPGENDRRMMNYMLDRLEDIGAAAGAYEIALTDYRDKDGIYRTPAWHMIGTCRMGDAPEASVVNSWQQSWDVPNMFIVDGSVLPTGGVVNPTPTISAMALRAAEYVRDSFAELSATTRTEAA